MASSAAAADTDGRLKELLYRAEAERLQLQQQAAGLAGDKQQLTADVLKLRQQLAEVHAAVVDSQQQVSQLSRGRDQLTAQLQAAVAEYRANDIITIGLRDHITRLQLQLKDSQQLCSQQAAVLATFEDDMLSLQSCKVDLTQQLQQLQQQHLQLQEQYGGTLQQLARAHQEAQKSQQRWGDQHGDQARQLQAVQEARQQAENRVEELSTQLEQEQQQVAQHKDRITELEAELSRIRDLVILLGKAMGRLPGGQQLPGHDDPVWLKLGPLGGISFALDTVMQHTREQHVRVRELQVEFDKVQDSVRAEAAQKADLQSELYDARTMYAKAVAVREALEARTSRAEAERAAAETNLQQARTQAGEDGSRLSSLQEQVLSLSQQVQLLQPLQPKLSTTEVERDTALHKLERLQEQCDQLQRQLAHVTAREAGLQAEVDAYQLEHSQLLAANTQLVAQCTGLNREVQALEVSAREGSAAKGQLEEAKAKLSRTKTQLQSMTERHVDTLSKLETTKELLASSPTGSYSSSRPVSPWGKSSRPGTAASRPGTAGARRVAFPDSAGSSPRPSPRGSCICDVPQHAGAAGTSSKAAAGGGMGVNAMAGPAPEQQLCVGEEGGAELARSMSEDVDAIVRYRELECLAEEQQQDLEELANQLQQGREDKGRLEVQIAQLEVQLLEQEAQHLQQLQASEQAVSGQCMAAAAEAAAALQAALHELTQAMAGPAQDSTDSNAAAAFATGMQESAGDCRGRSASIDEAGTTSDTVSLGLEQPQQPQAHQQQQQQQQPTSWLGSVVSEMLANMQSMVDQAQARAALLAARQSVGVQSDEALPSQWLAFLRGLPDAAVVQPLHLRAASEAILRIYMRGLGQLEATRSLQRQQGWGAGGGATLTVFDLLMAHYTLPTQQPQLQQQQQGRLGVQPYSAARWKDPQGPITRLLVSCRALAPSSVKVALFCCLAGTHTPGLTGASRGTQHWQQFLLLLLHAAKQLTGGLWKPLLRDWASAGGALLPLQCVLDLLGNVYNASSLAVLEQQPALLGSRQLVLEAAASSAGSPAPSVAGGSRAPSVSGSSSSRVGTPKAAQQGRPGTAAAQQLQAQLQAQRAGTVAAAVQELLVDGPLGAASAVDFDDLLAMLMVQLDAGLLPPHPLMQPRRLTTGDLGNTTNAWGSAVSEAAAGVLSRRSVALSAGAVPPVPAAAVPGLLVSESSDAGRSDWGCFQASASGSPTAAGGWPSRPTTAASPTSRIGTAAALPRLKTPDSGALDAHRSSSTIGSSSVSGAHSPAGALLPSLAGGKQAQSIRKGLSVSRVAFRDDLPRDS